MSQLRRPIKDKNIIFALKWMGGSADPEGPAFPFVGLTYDSWIGANNKNMDPEFLVYCSEYPDEGVMPIGQGYGKVGDRLWCAETWRSVNNSGYAAIVYRSDGEVLDLDKLGNGSFIENSLINYQDTRLKNIDFSLAACDIGDEREEGTGWYPSSQMPRWASRITLEITDVCIERLQDISEEDARANGAGTEDFLNRVPPKPSSEFMYLCDDLYGKDSWDKNPWVWVIDFNGVESK